MLLRVVFVAGGIIAMISGCNGLVSSTFGTHRLRELTFAEASRGVGDADYVRITDARLSDTVLARITGEADKRYYFVAVQVDSNRPLQAVGAYQPVAWSTTAFPTHPSATVTGTVESPPTVVRESLVRQAALPPARTYVYLHVDRQPLAWYWQAALFVGGLLLAAGTEWWNNLRS